MQTAPTCDGRVEDQGLNQAVPRDALINKKRRDP
jgi:hypothetical protein